MYIFVIIDSLASNSSTIKDDVNQSSYSSSPYPPPTPPIQLPTTNNKDDIIMNEFVKPSKIHIQSLHRDDLLYESQKINPGKKSVVFLGGKCIITRNIQQNDLSIKNFNQIFISFNKQKCYRKIYQLDDL